MLPDRPTPSFPYRLEEQIGMGSMGVVYRATEVALDRPVAIKTLRLSLLREESPEVQDEMRRRFLQEAQAAGRLSHPGITTVYRVGEEGEIPYLAMEWLDGQTLERFQREKGPLPVELALSLVAELLDALHVAHRAGVVHRDIKPSNLMVLGDGRLKVTDFGIALVRGRELVHTQAGVLLATPKFASPEQLRGSEIDGRSDLFSAGVLLFHLITGDFPFAGDHFMELAGNILGAEPRPLRQFLPGTSAELEALLRVALSKNRDERFKDARQMADELRTLVLGRDAAKDRPALLESGPRSGPTSKAAEESGTPTERLATLTQNLSNDPALALVQLVESWPGKTLGRQNTRNLLDRLLEKPLHAAPFHGAVRIDQFCVLLCGGFVVGAIDGATGEYGEAVEENLPELGEAHLHPLPSHFPENLVSLLSSILHSPKVVQAEFDTSLIHFRAWSEKLREQRFDGLLRVRRSDEAWAMIFFAEGLAVQALFSAAWGETPTGSWTGWLADTSARARLEAPQRRPSALYFRRAFADLPLRVEPVQKDGQGDTLGTTSSRLRQIFRSTQNGGTSIATLSFRVIPQEKPEAAGDPLESPPGRFLLWALGELPHFLAERQQTAAWKYLVDWLALVRQAQLHHHLERPDSRDNDVFDLVTRDEAGKVLHLADRVAKATPAAFTAFHDKVIEAKTARKKTGDVGGVFWIAPRFSDETLLAYRQVLHKAGSSSWFSVEENFTGYAGFVRIGPRRGFHLMLIEEREDGSFLPLLPT